MRSGLLAWELKPDDFATGKGFSESLTFLETLKHSTGAFMSSRCKLFKGISLLLLFVGASAPLRAIGMDSQSPAAAADGGVQWISSVAYDVTPSGKDATFNIRVTAPKIGSAGFPCGGMPVVLDALQLSSDDVSPLGEARITDDDRKPTQDQQHPNSYLYQLKIGDGMPLPNDWTAVRFSLAAHCQAPVPGAHKSPVIEVRRSLSGNPAEVRIKPGEPLWYQSQSGKDTVTLTLLATRPITIDQVAIREVDPPNNQITQAKSDPIESTQHQIHFTDKDFNEQIRPGTSYTLALRARDNGQEWKGTILPFTFVRPLRDYTVNGILNKEVLDVRDGTPLELNVLTNDEGSLTMIFDNPLADGKAVIQEQNQAAKSDASKHIFRIETKGLQDGHYNFRFQGTRKNPPDSLNDPHTYLLNVDTTTRPVGSLGMKLEEQTVVLSYCLSRDVSSAIEIHRLVGGKEEDSDFFHKGADKKGTCGKGAFPYTASIDLKNFADQLSSKVPASGDGGANTGEAAPAKNPAQPIVLHIRDTDANRDVMALNLDAVAVTNSQKVIQQLTDQIKILSGNGDSNTKNAAQEQLKKVLTSNSVSSDAADALLKSIRKKDNGFGQAVGTIFTSLLKSVATAYLGIPAAKQ